MIAMQHRRREGKYVIYGDGERMPTETMNRAKRLPGLWRQSSENGLKVGYRLQDLRRWMSREDFSSYIRKGLADFGISRSSAYRWMVLSEKLNGLFPNFMVCDAVMRLCDGRGIFAPYRIPEKPALRQASTEQDGKRQDHPQFPYPSRTPLTAAAQAALAGLPDPPAEDKGYESANGWAKSFIKAMNQARARQRAEERAARRTPQKQGDEILRKLNAFAADFGPEEFRNFCEQMDRLFGPRTAGAKVDRQTATAGGKSDVVVQFGAEAQSQLETQTKAEIQSQLEIEGKAETELAYADGEERSPISQSQLGTEGFHRGARRRASGFPIPN
jgi:hypothetical protein